MEAWEISEQKAAGTLPRQRPWSEPGGKSTGKTSPRCSRVFFGKVLVLLEGLGLQCVTHEERAYGVFLLPTPLGCNLTSSGMWGWGPSAETGAGVLLTLPTVTG